MSPAPLSTHTPLADHAREQEPAEHEICWLGSRKFRTSLGTPRVTSCLPRATGESTSISLRTTAYSSACVMKSQGRRNFNRNFGVRQAGAGSLALASVAPGCRSPQVVTVP